MPIRILPPSVISQIAAGEVIDRPASVLRELIDNALDVRARRIEVSFRGDGRNFLSVSDNGCGIEGSELALALCRHATSKLDDDNISHISTLGFRGEALASIAAVADIVLESRVEDSDVAWSVRSEDGRIVSPSPAALSVGTRITVRDLFRRIPARLKFLRSEKIEAALLRECFMSAALSAPWTEFVLISRGKPQRFAADFELPFASRRVSDVMGAGFMKDAVEIEYCRNDIRIRGFACVPTRSRKDGREQAIFVNGRQVRDKGLTSALRAAYAGLMEGGLFPCAVLYIDIDPSEVDVNVHPAKLEVRFASPGDVHRHVTAAVRDSLLGTGIRTSQEISDRAVEAFAESPELPAGGDRRRLPLGRIIGQAHQSFLISETLDGIAVIDQHAAHERILLERLKESVLSCGAEARLLPAPLEVPLPGVQAALMAERAGQLACLGLQFELSGEVSIRVTSVPALLGAADPVKLVTDIASSIDEHPAGDLLQERLEEICSLFACHNAIRAEDDLSSEAADRLLREMESCPAASQCNHGRPTVVFLSRRQLETLFERR